MCGIPDAPWIKYADNNGRPYNDGYSQEDYEYDCQDDERDNEIFNEMLEEGEQ